MPANFGPDAFGYIIDSSTRRDATVYGDRTSRPWTFEDVVLFLYLIVGAAGTLALLALQTGIADGPTDVPIVWTVAFFPVAFTCGLAWAIGRMRRMS